LHSTDSLGFVWLSGSRANGCDSHISQAAASTHLRRWNYCFAFGSCIASLARLALLNLDFWNGFLDSSSKMVSLILLPPQGTGHVARQTWQGTFWWVPIHGLLPAALLDALQQKICVKVSVLPEQRLLHRCKQSEPLCPLLPANPHVPWCSLESCLNTLH